MINAIAVNDHNRDALARAMMIALETMGPAVVFRFFVGQDAHAISLLRYRATHWDRHTALYVVIPTMSNSVTVACLEPFTADGEVFRNIEGLPSLAVLNALREGIETTTGIQEA